MTTRVTNNISQVLVRRVSGSPGLRLVEASILGGQAVQWVTLVWFWLCWTIQWGCVWWSHVQLQEHDVFSLHTQIHASHSILWNKGFSLDSVSVWCLGLKNMHNILVFTMFLQLQFYLSCLYFKRIKLFLFVICFLFYPVLCGVR